MAKPNFKYVAKPPEFQKSRSVCQMLPGPPDSSYCAGVTSPVNPAGLSVEAGA